MVTYFIELVHWLLTGLPWNTRDSMEVSKHTHSTRTTVTVGMWVVLHFVCNKESTNMCPSRLENLTSMLFQTINRRQVTHSCATMTRPRHVNSAIGQHLLTHLECAKSYNDNRFSILARGRSLFHLKVLESTIIKLEQPILCRQKDRLYSLCVFH